MNTFSDHCKFIYDDIYCMCMVKTTVTTVTLVRMVLLIFLEANVHENYENPLKLVKAVTGHSLFDCVSGTAKTNASFRQMVSSKSNYIIHPDQFSLFSGESKFVYC